MGFIQSSNRRNRLAIYFPISLTNSNIEVAWLKLHLEMDEFDTVLRLEHQIYEEGKSTGEKDAKAKAYKECYDFGVHQEIGFISGFLQFYAITTENFTTNKYPENIYKTMKQLMRLISDIDMDAGNLTLNHSLVSISNFSEDRKNPQPLFF
jgi:hypothetical protein